MPPETPGTLFATPIESPLMKRKILSKKLRFLAINYALFDMLASFSKSKINKKPPINKMMAIINCGSP